MKCINGHTAKTTPVCQHVLNREIETGVKRFTGVSDNFELLCEHCLTLETYKHHYLCDSCLEEVEGEADWMFHGMPEIPFRNESFTFEDTVYEFKELKDNAVIATAADPNNSAWLIFLANGKLFYFDPIKNRLVHKLSISDDCIRRDGCINLKISHDSSMIAITSCAPYIYDTHVSDMPLLKAASNHGGVFDLCSGEMLFKLDMDSYHTENNDFPLAFIQQGERALLIHGTDWNRVDISDPRTSECLTARDIDYKARAVDTEWLGRLIVTPDLQWVATVGWVWHPIGICYAWNLQVWLNENPWEPEYGKSKKKFSAWEYFWEGPFCWLSNELLCIWGYDKYHDANDTPLDSVAIYNVKTGELASWFAGPTKEVFFFDGYLFSGKPDSGGAKALTIWDVSDGALLYTEPDLAPLDYHADTREFISIDTDKAQIKLTTWFNLDSAVGGVCLS